MWKYLFFGNVENVEKCGKNVEKCGKMWNVEKCGKMWKNVEVKKTPPQQFQKVFHFFKTTKMWKMWKIIKKCGKMWKNVEVKKTVVSKSFPFFQNNKNVENVEKMWKRKKQHFQKVVHFFKTILI